MEKSHFRILVLLLAIVLLIWGALLFQMVYSMRTLKTPSAIPTAVARATDTTVPVYPTKTPAPLPPTWTATATWTPPPTWTPEPPTPTETPWPTATSIPLPVDEYPERHRPTPMVIDILPTTHPSSTYAVPTAVPLQPIPGEAITILLLGSDQRPDWSDWHTDAIQYVVIYPDVPAVNMLSIPRDLYVYIPGVTMNRINFADMYGVMYDYEGGGLGLLNQTLLYNLGISADYYVMVNFDGLIGLVNTLEGIDVPVYCRVEDFWPYADEQGVYPRFALEPGIHHLDGEQALWYSRTRKTTSVFSRERRQQQVLEALWRRARDRNLVEIAPTLYEQTQSMYQTDLGVADIFSLVTVASQIDPADVHRYNIGRQEVIPYTTYQGGNVFIPIWENIQPVVQNVLTKPSASRAFQEPIPVEVWNGAGNPDWDRLAADLLLHNGYVPVVGTADRTDYAQTTIVYFNEVTKGSGLERLQALFNVAPENVILLPDPQAQFKARLIVGRDYVTCP